MYRMHVSYVCIVCMYRLYVYMYVLYVCMYVCTACFHPHLPIILTGSEDGTVRIWHSITYRLENTLNYGLGRVWALAYLKGMYVSYVCIVCMYICNMYCMYVCMYVLYVCMYVCKACFHPNLPIILTGSEDGTYRIYI